MTNSNNILFLLQKVIDGKASVTEHDQLWEAVKSDSQGELMDEIRIYLLADQQNIPEQPHNYILWERLGREILQSDKIKEPQPLTTELQPADTPPIYSMPTHRIHFLKTAWFKYSAAILILITGITLYYNFFHNSHAGKELVQNTSTALPVDVPPGFSRAVLTLSNGEKVEINNSTSETIIDGSLSIKNDNGQLSYNSEKLPIPSSGSVGGRVSDQGGFNTMSTPMGGQYKLTLSDGTKIWLNAASSITFPIAFTGSVRRVSITGEVYFEVKNNSAQPFIVKTPGDEITVLGTHFNVNAYPDEAAIKTSLLEGSVRVGGLVLKPGQAFINGKITATNLEQDVAWKNGFFNFENASLAEVMRQLKRWYDIEVVYANGIPDIEFGGKLTKDIPLGDLLIVLEKSKVHFRIEGRRLIVLP